MDARNCLRVRLLQALVRIIGENRREFEISIAQLTGSRSLESIRARFCRSLLISNANRRAFALAAYRAPNMFFA
jgi:membrane-bound lytic murein transglycosylase MltF